MALGQSPIGERPPRPAGRPPTPVKHKGRDWGKWVSEWDVGGMWAGSGLWVVKSCK